jgi:hypothetical protein
MSRLNMGNSGYQFQMKSELDDVFNTFDIA